MNPIETLKHQIRIVDIERIQDDFVPVVTHRVVVVNEEASVVRCVRVLSTFLLNHFQPKTGEIHVCERIECGKLLYNTSIIGATYNRTQTKKWKPKMKLMCFL